jgi:hypothetical protein
VASLEGLFNDARLALDTLRDTSRLVQSMGWHFNTDTDVLLTPLDTAEIVLPANCVRVDIDPRRERRQITQRGSKLYDKVERSFAFSAPVRVSMVTLLTWDELPEPVRQYVKARALSRFQNRTLGDPGLTNFSAADEAEARAALKGFEADTGNHNMLTGSWDVFRIINR